MKPLGQKNHPFLNPLIRFQFCILFINYSQKKRDYQSIASLFLLWERLNPLALRTFAKNFNRSFATALCLLAARARIGCTYRQWRYIACAEIRSSALLLHTNQINAKSRAANSRMVFAGRFCGHLSLFNLFQNLFNVTILSSRALSHCVITLSNILYFFSTKRIFLFTSKKTI